MMGYSKLGGLDNDYILFLALKERPQASILSVCSSEAVGTIWLETTSDRPNNTNRGNKINGVRHTGVAQ
jgi:hypothetical protein